MSKSTEMVAVELWILVDEDGDYEVAKERGDLSVPDELATRWVKIAVQVPKPRAVSLVATVAEEADAGELRAV